MILSVFAIMLVDRVGIGKSARFLSYLVLSKEQDVQDVQGADGTSTTLEPCAEPTFTGGKSTLHKVLVNFRSRRALS